MSIFAPAAVKAPSLHALLDHELQDLYDAEFQILEALPKMIEQVTDKDLKHALSHHMKETETHVTRLEKIFSLLQENPKRMTCDGMKGLIKEGEHVLKGDMDPTVKDDAIIGAAQRVEHYEMAGYGTARQHAKNLGFKDIADILNETLQEEGAADHKLSEIARKMHQGMPHAKRTTVNG